MSIYHTQRIVKSKSNFSTDIIEYKPSYNILWVKIYINSDTGGYLDIDASNDKKDWISVVDSRTLKNNKFIDINLSPQYNYYQIKYCNKSINNQSILISVTSNGLPFNNKSLADYNTCYSKLIRKDQTIIKVSDKSVTLRNTIIFSDTELTLFIYTHDNNIPFLILAIPKDITTQHRLNIFLPEKFYFKVSSTNKKKFKLFVTFIFSYY